MKVFTLIGGVNGAGKSSLTGSLKAERTDLGVIVDPDKITAETGGDEYEGGKLAVERIERALADGINLTQETTLSGGYPKRLAKRAKETGYISACTMWGWIRFQKACTVFKTVWQRVGMISHIMMWNAASPVVLLML